MSQVFAEAEVLLQKRPAIEQGDSQPSVVPLPKGWCYPILPAPCFRVDYSVSEVERLLREYALLHGDSPELRMSKNEKRLAELQDRLRDLQRAPPNRSFVVPLHASNVNTVKPHEREISAS